VTINTECPACGVATDAPERRPDKISIVFEHACERVLCAPVGSVRIELDALRSMLLRCIAGYCGDCAHAIVRVPAERNEEH
jgi:hypothetical protein